MVESCGFARGTFIACVALLAASAIARGQEQSGSNEPRLEAERVVVGSGVALPLTAWLPQTQTPRAAIVALHGLNEHSGAFAAAGMQLAVNGYAVYAYDQRGFGANPEPGLWAGGDVLATDARQVAALVRQRHPGVPLYVVGESMGGAVLLRALAQEAQGWLDGAVLLAPAIWNRRDMPWYQRFGLTLLTHTVPELKVSRPSSRAPSDDPATLRRLRDDPLVIKKMRVDALAGVSDLMDEITAARSTIEVPLLVLYGVNDRIMPARPFCRWVANLDPADPWRLAVYPQGWHLLLRDLDTATAMADLTAWLKDGSSPLPSPFEVQRPFDFESCLALVKR